MQGAMQAISFDQLIEATRLLGPQEREALAQVLHLATTLPEAGDSFADPDELDEVLNEAGAFSVFSALSDVHAQAAAITGEQLLAASQCISCEWEEEPA